MRSAPPPAMPKPLVIFGLADIASVIRVFLEQEGRRRVVAFTADRAYVDGRGLDGLPLVPFEDLPDVHPPETVEIFIAAAYGEFNRTRLALMEKARAAGYRLASHVSPRAAVWTDQIGENVLICEHVTVQPFARIGDGAFLWPGTVVVHHAEVGAGCYLGPQAFIGGHVRLGRGVTAGPQAVIASHRSVGDHAFIGAGAAAFGETADGAVMLAPSTRPAPFASDDAPAPLRQRLFNGG